MGRLEEAKERRSRLSLPLQCMVLMVDIVFGGRGLVCQLWLVGNGPVRRSWKARFGKSIMKGMDRLGLVRFGSACQLCKARLGSEGQLWMAGIGPACQL
ncbi:hypothetical protein B6U67_00770 [Methanosarcinales archaeon ex4484_138]|nr:MAG: hypothetical protein B6U67_00770 [Methanosarcinales archaeon ex4484_138]